jgi:hypothetical protein
MSVKLIEIDDDNVEEFSAFIDEDLQEQLNREFFRGIGAVDPSDTPVGALVYELKNLESEEDTKSRIRLLKAQSEEIENEILTEYAEAIKEDEVTESFYESPDDSLAEYLKANGFSLTRGEGMDLVITVDQIRSLTNILKGRSTPTYIKSLSEISALQFRTFVKECLFKGEKGLVEDLAYIPKSWFEQEVSTCVVTDDKVNGSLLIRRSAGGDLYAMLLTAFGADYQRNLALMMSFCANRVMELYPEDTKIVIRRHNSKVQKLTEKLFASSKGAEMYSGTRKEEG